MKKLTTLKILLSLADLQNIQVMGDSQLVIDWSKQRRLPKNIYLGPLYEDLKLLLGTFHWATFQHIFRERNMVVDRLLKDGRHTGFGLWNMRGFSGE